MSIPNVGEPVTIPMVPNVGWSGRTEANFIGQRIAPGSIGCRHASNIGGFPYSGE